MGKKPPKKWPADWPEKVSVQPVVDYLERKGKPPLTDEQLLVLNIICDEARRTNMPPYISISLRDRIKKIGKPLHILELMGISTIKCGELKRQRREWVAERARLGLSPRAAKAVAGVAGSAAAQTRSQGGGNPPKACGEIHRTARMRRLSLKNSKRNGVEPCGLAPFLRVWRKNSDFEGNLWGKIQCT